MALQNVSLVLHFLQKENLIYHEYKIKCSILIGYTFSVLILTMFWLFWLLVGESRSLLPFYEEDKLVNGSF